MDTTDPLPEAPACSCELAEQLQQESFLDQVAEQQQEELGYVLPVMAELYNETTLSSPIESVLDSDACQCPASDATGPDRDEDPSETQS